MRIENLKVGMVLKNYKHLCSLLCIEPRGKAGSNSRIAQIKEINRSVKYKKLEGGNKLVILEIYNELKDKEDFRTKGNNSKYVENIEKIVLYTLNKHNSNEALILSRGRLLEVCNMINENYRIGKQNISKISALTEIEAEYIYNFYSNSNAMLTKSITSALRSLRNRRLVDFYEIIMICEDVVVPVVSEQGEVGFTKTGSQRFREATDEERKIILKYEKEAMRMLGCRKVQDIVLKGKWREYKQLSETMLRNMYNRNINYYYSAYKLICNADDIKQEITLLELNNNKNNLNNKLSSSMTRSTKTRHTKAINNGLFNKIESNEDYVSKQLTLVELLIKDNPKDRL